MSAADLKNLDMKLEVLIIPVSDVERATEFYLRLGWRQDVTPPNSGVVQITPHGSGCSIQFGANLTTAAPGSSSAFLIVADIEAARAALIAAGVEVSDFWHYGANGRGEGLDPERGSYLSRADFTDPDGNTWQMQEITTRLPGRIEPGVTSYGSATDLQSAMWRAAQAHGEHEKRIGKEDANWPEWYAKYMVSEQTGVDLPT